MATTNDLKNGLVLNIDGQLWTVVEFQHVKPGKGGAFVRTKLKNVLSGKVVDKTFNAGVKVDVATVDKRDMHPGPMNRGVEIDSEVADDLNVSLIQDQVEMGVATRMAILATIAARLDNR